MHNQGTTIIRRVTHERVTQLKVNILSFDVHINIVVNINY